jgi:hypothetical protein
VVGANLGIEAVTWIPDAFPTAAGFVDESKNKACTPADYPNRGDVLCFVGVAATGVLMHSPAQTRSQRSDCRTGTTAKGTNVPNVNTSNRIENCASLS